jgi:putative hydrolase of the HAD superfamily
MACGSRPSPQGGVDRGPAWLGVDALIATRREWSKRSLQPRPDALETLAELRRRGHLLGLISVCSQDVPHVWNETPFSGALDEVVFSCDVGVSKPDPRI